MFLWFLKGEIKQECLPSREHQQRLYVEIYYKYIFHKGKKLQVAVLQSIPTEQTRKFNHPGYKQGSEKSLLSNS